MNNTKIASNIALIRENIDRAMHQAGRDDEAKIIAITKTRTPEEINELIIHNIFTIGENRVQELIEKYDKISSRFDIQVVGQLQTNKVKYIADKVSCVQSLDRIALANTLETHYSRINAGVDVLVQVNLTDDPARGGVKPSEVVRFCDDVQKYPSLRLKGLMAVAPVGLNEYELRKCFSGMCKLYSDLKNDIKSVDRLSMGMSNDYVPAILEGATEVRLGSAIFGERNIKL